MQTHMQERKHETIQKKNHTGLSDNLKSSTENMSGYSMSDVKVHYNSSKPAQMQALAYTHGTDIYVGPGQEKHLPHEAWHVVQQKRGRISPTMLLQGNMVNDEEQLETEADKMGKIAENSLQNADWRPSNILYNKNVIQPVVQRMIDFKALLALIESLKVHTKPLKYVVENSQGVSFAILKEAIEKEVQGLSLSDREKRIQELRELAEGLPESCDESAVNLLYKVLNMFDSRITDSEAVHLGPSRIAHSKLTQASAKDSDKESGSDHQHISNRGIQQVVRIEGRLFTTVYMTVFADASGKGDKRPEHKDFEQDENGQIKIHTGGSGPGEATLWISIGRPLRQVKWMELYGSKGGRPLIRSFLIPLEIANAISGQTATEHGTAGLSIDMNVDKHYERNQTGIGNPNSLEMLRRYALPGSLRTYYDDSIVEVSPEEGQKESPKERAKERWGETRPVSEMKGKLGIPEQKLKDFDIFVETGVGGFVSQAAYEEQADILSNVYVIYKGLGSLRNEKALLPEGEEDLELNEAIALYEQIVQKFYEEHSPREGISLEDFMEKYVCGWASQAQIAKTLADDYEEITKEVDSLPEKAPEITFPTSPTSGRRGERRSAAVSLSHHIQVLMHGRYKFLEELEQVADDINKMVRDASVESVVKEFLQKKVLFEINKIKGDYLFVIGDINAIEDRLPVYRATILGFLEYLNDIQVQLEHMESQQPEKKEEDSEEMDFSYGMLWGEEETSGQLKKEEEVTEITQKEKEDSREVPKEKLYVKASTKDILESLTEGLRKALYVPIYTEVPRPTAKIKPPNGEKQERLEKEKQQEEVENSEKPKENRIPNRTLADGNCFYHAIYEALNGGTSSIATQQTIRGRIVQALRENPRLAESHFGIGPSGQRALEAFIGRVSQAGTWVPDYGPAIIADALGIRIIVHRVDGSVYFNAEPNPVFTSIPTRTIHLQYTGAHYNSYRE